MEVLYLAAKNRGNENRKATRMCFVAREGWKPIALFRRPSLTQMSFAIATKAIHSTYTSFCPEQTTAQIRSRTLTFVLRTQNSGSDSPKTHGRTHRVHLYEGFLPAKFLHCLGILLYHRRHRTLSSACLLSSQRLES